MNPQELLLEAAQIFEERGSTYGSADYLENNFQLAADLASLKLGMNLHPYHIATVMACVKEARIFASPDHRDSHLDAVNYQLFALIFSQDYVRTMREKGSGEQYQKKAERVAAVAAPIAKAEKVNLQDLLINRDRPVRRSDLAEPADA